MECRPCGASARVNPEGSQGDRHMSNRNWVITIVVIIVILAIIGWYAGWFGASTPEATAPAPTTEQTTPAPSD